MIHEEVTDQLSSLQSTYVEELKQLKDQYLTLGDYGRKIVQAIASDPNTLYVFCPWGSGDTLAVAAYLSHIRDYRKPGSLALVCKKNQADIAEMFDSIDRQISISGDECDCIAIASYLYLMNYGPNYIIGNLGLFNHLSFPHRLMPFKLFVLQVPENASPDKVSDRFYDPYNEALASEWKNHIILAPYAVAFPLLPTAFWEALARALAEKGYEVYTNVYREEAVINGTKRLEVSIREVFQLARYSAGMITYRSGFSDIMALQPDLKHVVINPDERTMSYDDCSVLGNAKELLNLVYAPDAESSIISQITNYFAR